MVGPYGMTVSEKRRTVDRNIMKGRLRPNADVHWSLHSASRGTVPMSRKGAGGRGGGEGLMSMCVGVCVYCWWRDGLMSVCVYGGWICVCVCVLLVGGRD